MVTWVPGSEWGRDRKGQEGGTDYKAAQGNFWRCWEYSTYYIMVLVVIIYLNCTSNIFDLKKGKDISLRAPTMRRIQ